MFKIASKTVCVAIVSFLSFGAADSAFAGNGKWAQHHPRRVQVNKRLDNQNRRINKELQQGKITQAQAANLHKQDRQIRREERMMASQNGSHITKQEQHTLNQQENAVSRRIGN